MQACEGQTLAALLIKTCVIYFRKMRNLRSILDLIKRNAASLDLPEPTIPRKRKKPAKHLGKQETPQYNDIAEGKLMYKRE